MTNETGKIKAEIIGLNSLKGIDGLWDKIDAEVDALFENSKRILNLGGSAELAEFALGCKNPRDQDATDAPSQSPVEVEQ
jgi:hypothetical protein